MSIKTKQTFREILLAAGPMNAQILEDKANIAALLAGNYPKHQSVLRGIETKALGRMFWILADTANEADTWNIADKWNDRARAGVGLAAD